MIVYGFGVKQRLQISDWSKTNCESERTDHAWADLQIFVLELAFFWATN